MKFHAIHMSLCFSVMVGVHCPLRECTVSRVCEVERLLNHTYSSCEHCWESNMTFSVAHVSTTVPSLVLFYFTSFSTHSSQHSSSTVAEAVDTVDRFLQL